MVFKSTSIRLTAVAAIAGAFLFSLTGGPAALSAQAETGDGAALPADAVAVVNDEAISAEDFRSFVKTYVAQNYYHGVEADKLPAIADEALDLLVTDRLLLQEARRRKLSGDRAAAQKRFDALKARYAKNPEAAAKFNEFGADIEKELRDDTRVEELRNLIRDVGVPEQAAVKDYYDKHRDLFTTPAATDLSIILIGVPPHGLGEEWKNALETAAQIRAQILAGAAFESLAKDKSTHASAADGGRLGPLHKGQMVEEVEAAVAPLAVGGISEPLRLLEGAAIFKVNNRKAASLQPFAAVEDRASSLLVREMQETRWKAFVEDLRKSARIKTAGSLVEYVRDL